MISLTTQNKKDINNINCDILFKTQIISNKKNINYYSTGKRKNAIARVWLKNGDGQIIINNNKKHYIINNESYIKTLIQPFTITNTTKQYNVLCTVKGGGTSGQISAILHGIAKTLNKINPESHDILRKSGFLTRDSRIVERKKYGKHKARKSTQFSKR